MGRKFFQSVAAAVLSLSAGVAVASPSLNGIGVGWRLSSLAGDVAIGATVSSPRFVHDRLHLELTGDYAWQPGVPVAGATSTAWSPFGEIRLGLCSDYTRTDFVRIYGCGGAFGLLPSGSLSSQSFSAGGYGSVDFEFVMGSERHDMAYIELGAQGTGATADRSPGNPSIANGFTTSVGWKYFFD